MQTFEETIKSYLDRFAADDDAFAASYDPGRINDCCDYIQQYMDDPAYPDLDHYALAIAWYERGEDEIDPADFCTEAPAPAHPFQRESEVERRLHHAINHGDLKTIAYFRQFGEDLRHQIMNAHVYEQYRFCGYEGEFKTDEYGWARYNGELEQRTSKDTLFDEGKWHLHLLTLQHPNGKWVAGKSYMFSTSGGCGGASLWSTWYDTREDAARAVLEPALRDLESDGTAKAKKYIPIVKRYLWNLKQSSLFGDEPVSAPAVIKTDAHAPAPIQLTFDF